MKCKLISLDTSTGCSGYAKYVDGKLKKYGCFDNRKITNKKEKFDKTIKDIISYLDKEKPDVVVIELTAVCRNGNTQRKLTEIIGIVYAWCLFNNCFYEEMRPLQWRKLVCDINEKQPKKRAELKAWSVNKVRELFNTDVNDDTADAILVGLAYINKYREM